MKKLLVCMLFVLFGTQVFAKEHYKGLGAYESEDFDVAIKELKPLGEQGNVKAQELVGLMYYRGQGVPEDNALALKWFLLAAKQGNNHAQLMLGIMHTFGHSVGTDYKLAYMWHNLAAFNGHPEGDFLKDKIAKRLSRSELNTAQSMARECMASDYKKCGY